jgi:hypothetical protein
MTHFTRFYRLILPILLIVGGCMLSACSSGNVLGNVLGDVLSDCYAEPTTLRPSLTHANREEITLSYTIGCDATVSVWVESTDETASAPSASYQLRSQEPRSASSDPYVLRFDGTVPTDDPTIQRRLLPSGRYTMRVRAESDRCGTKEVTQPITIEESDVAMPEIEHLVVYPETISPNADAIDDVAQISYRLPTTATVNIEVTTPAGETFPLLSRDEQLPAEQTHVWDGKRPNGSELSAGVYTYTITAEDHYGNLVQRRKQITLEHVGEPEATITYARIAPQHLMIGRVLSITMRVKNTGPVVIRTYGPPSGYTYTTEEVFSSVEDGAYRSQPGGFWRVGVDWDANSGDGPKRYPFRWALSDRHPDEWKIPGKEDWLLPGEEVEVVGRVIVLQRERKMGFYAGLIQDGVGFFQNYTARTIVRVGF